MVSRFVLFAAFQFALPAVDFSGSWAMVVARSNFAGSHPPQSLTMTVRQTAAQLVVQSTLVDARGSSTNSYTLDLSGKEAGNTIRGNKVVSTSAWRGPMLHVKAKTLVQGTEIKTVDQWQLEEGGRVLTIYRTATTPNGDSEQRFVYVNTLAKL